MSKLDQRFDDMAYRYYITNCLQLAPQGKTLKHSFSDIMEGNIKEDKRSGDEIAADIIMKANLSWGKNK